MSLNSRIIKKLFLPLTFICLGIFSSKLSAKAETVELTQREAPASMSEIAPRSTSILQKSQAQAIVQTFTLQQAALLGEPISRFNNSVITNPEIQPSSASQIAQSAQPSSVPTAPSTDVPGRAIPQTVPSNTPTNPSVTPSTPTPGTTTPGTIVPETTTPGTTTPGTTTPGTTTPGTVTPVTPQTTPDTTTPTQPLAPTEVSPGRGTRSGSSYVGIGGNIGIGSGDTELGQGSFAVLSKIGLTRDFSVRPTFLFTDSVTILLPITYDFSFGEDPTGGLGFTAAPFLGVGAAISTGDGADVGLLLTGGIDVPLSSQFTATASVNASVTGEAAVGILVGVGYNFAGF